MPENESGHSEVVEKTGVQSGHSELCKRCNGTGNLPDPPVWRSTMGVRTSHACPDCHGTGWR